MERTPRSTRLLSEARMEVPELWTFGGGQAAAFSCACPRKGNRNEDAAALIPLGPDSGLLVVADGLGGLRAGAAAARLAIQSLIDAVAALEAAGPFDGDELRNAVLTAIERANREIGAFDESAGTTLAVAEILDGALRPFHVGDSPIFLVGRTGDVRLWTVPHSPVGYAIQAGLLSEEQAMFHEDRHLVFNVVGMSDMRIEVGSPVPLERGDTVLVASDGLIDNLYTDEILGLICGRSVEQAAGGLADLARERMQTPREGLPSKPDDLTFLLYR